MKLDMINGETDPHRERVLRFAVPASDLRELTDRVPFDLDAFLNQCMGNTDFALKMIDKFTGTASERIAALGQAADSAELRELSAMAHALKGVAGIFVARKLCELCSDLTDAASTNDIDGSRQLVQRLCREIHRFMDYVSSIRAALSRSQAMS